MLSRSDMMRNMQAFDIDAEQLAKEVKNDAALEQIYYAIMPAQLKVVHLDDPEFAHEIMAEKFEMLACPFCKAHLFASSPDAREEGVEA